VANVHNLSKSGKLVIFSDVHIGANEFQEDKFLEALKFCKKEDAKIILNGDIAENSIISGSDAGEKIVEQKDHPTDQIKYATSKFRPFAKEGRIIGITRGNHESRTRRTAMLDICDILADSLQVPYWGVGGYVVLQHGSQRYIGAVQHGKSAGANTWTELDKLMRAYHNAEFGALGHNHDLNVRQVNYFGLDADDEENLIQRYQIRTGTYLGYAEYCRDSCIMPSLIGSPILSFGSKSHSISVDVQTLCW